MIIIIYGEYNKSVSRRRKRKKKKNQKYQKNTLSQRVSTCARLFPCPDQTFLPFFPSFSPLITTDNPPGGDQCSAWSVLRSEGCVIWWHRGWLFFHSSLFKPSETRGSTSFRAYQPVWDRRRRRKREKKKRKGWLSALRYISPVSVSLFDVPVLPHLRPSPYFRLWSFYVDFLLLLFAHSFVIVDDTVSVSSVVSGDIYHYWRRRPYYLIIAYPIINSLSTCHSFL